MADFSEPPQPECAWAIDYDDLKLMQFYVRNVTRPEWTRFQLELIQHEPSKFDAIDHGTMIDDRPISVLPPGVQDAPARVLISSHSAVDQGIAVTTMTIGWDAAPGAVAYDVEWRWGSRDWIKVPRTGELSVDVRGVYAGQYLARVRAINAMDVASIPTTSVLTDVAGKTTPPPAVSFLRTASEIFGIRLNWAFPEGAEDTLYTEVQESATADGSSPAQLGLISYPAATYLKSGMAAGVTRFFRARLGDRSGNTGPWTAWVMGQASSEARPILEYLAGQIDETALAEHLKERIDLIDGDGEGSVNERLKKLADNIGELADALVYDPGKAYAAGDVVRQGQRLYQAAVDVPAGDNAPPAAAYWLDIGEVLETANGLTLQVQQNTASIEELDGVVTATASQLRGLQAAYRDDDGTGEMDDAVQGWTAQAKITENYRVLASADQAIAERITELEASVGEDIAAKITELEQTIATNESATALHLEQLEASVGENTSAIQTVSQATADLEGNLETMWSVKMQVTADGQYVAAGIGLGIENTDAGLQSQFLVSADRFAMVSTLAGGATYTPFVVQNGQVFMNAAFIQDGAITSAKIGDYIQSTNFVAGQTGWRLSKDGTFEINATVSGQGRLVINNSLVQVFDANGVLRVRLGIWA